MAIASPPKRKMGRLTMGTGKAPEKGVGTVVREQDSPRTQNAVTHETLSLRIRTRWSSPSKVVLLLFATMSGCRTERDDKAAGGAAPVVVSASLAPVRFGEEAKTPYYRIRLLNWKPCAVEAHLEPPPGVRKVAVEVELTASGTTEVPSNPFYALLADRDGKLFESTLAGCPPLLEATRLSGGRSARGWITFDVPESAVPHALVYQPAVIGITAPKVELLLSP